MAINYNTDLGDTLDLGRDYVSVLKDGLNVSPDPTQVKPADVLQYPLDVEVDHQDMLLIRIFKQVENPLNLLTDPKGKGGLIQLGKKNVDGKEKTIVSKVNALTQRDEKFSKNLSDREANSLKKDSKYIWLPIPQQISDSLTVGYSEDTLNPLQAAGLTLAGAAIDDPAKAIKDTASVAANILQGGANIGSGTMNAIKSILSATAINQLGANVNPQSLITRSSGQILQSNLELLFNSVTLRSFPFVFDFTPRDPKEGDMVRRIIRTIKMATVAKKGNGVFINSPDVFQFEYVSGGENKHPFLHNFKLGVLENVSIDYTASGTYATYQDGTPVHIRMSLTLKEINPIYMEDYADHPDGVGF